MAAKSATKSTTKSPAKTAAPASVKTVDVELPTEIFDRPVNIPLIHQVVVAQRAAARQGTASTKTRGEVRGGGRKPYKQKGTGRARQGSTRAPQFVGGGVVHGPQPRSYDQRTPKKMKAAALRGVLSDRAREGRIHVVESLAGGETPSTRNAVAALLSLTDRSKFLVVVERHDTVTWLSLRNAPEAHLVAVDQLNTYDVIRTDDVVFTKAAYDAFVTGTASTSERPATIVEPTGDDAESIAPKIKATKPTRARDTEDETEDDTTVEPEVEATSTVVEDEFANSAQPLADGGAPDGYPVKGNKDSMKFHEPGGRWFDATIAEVWFRTAADAAAAGFVEAGTKTTDDEGDTK